MLFSPLMNNSAVRVKAGQGDLFTGDWLSTLWPEGDTLNLNIASLPSVKGCGATVCGATVCLLSWWPHDYPSLQDRQLCSSTPQAFIQGLHIKFVGCWVIIATLVRLSTTTTTECYGNLYTHIWWSFRSAARSQYCPLSRFRHVTHISSFSLMHLL